MRLPPQYIITHIPSGDEAEAETLAAAHLAARTLIDDNGHAGTSYIKALVAETVWHVYARPIGFGERRMTRRR